MMWLFHLLVIGHVIAGTMGLLSFWVPVLVVKGSASHKRWGRVFVISIYAAASMAVLMGILNLTLTSDRHAVLTDRGLYAGLFGWMMIYLGLLSLLFVHYGMAAIRNKRDHIANRSLMNLGPMVFVVLFAIKCTGEGVRLGQPLMIALGLLGLFAIATFARASLRTPNSVIAYQAEHLKAMLGAGISAYTAFLSVGLLRVVPAQVFNPLIWSLPSVVGVMLLIHHLRMLNARSRPSL